MLESWMGEFQVGAVEVVEIPEDYLKTTDTEKRDTNYRKSFMSILRGMIHAEVPIGLRLEHINGRTRVFFLTWTRKQEELNKNLTTLATSVAAYLPKFILTPAKEFKGLNVNLELNVNEMRWNLGSEKELRIGWIRKNGLIGKYVLKFTIVRMAPPVG